MKKLASMGVIISILGISLFSTAQLFGLPYDPPSQPPIELRVTITGVATAFDYDDGGDDKADLEINWNIVHHLHTPTGTLTIDYDWDKYQGAIRTLTHPRLLYTHVECTPESALTLNLDVEEHDRITADEELGTNPLQPTVPGTTILNIVDAIGTKAQIQVTTTVKPLTQKAQTENCGKE